MLSLIIPTYNEAANITTLLVKIEAVLQGRSYEILVVDDDSPDGTWRAVEDIEKTKPHIHLIRRRQERGLSSAVIEGFNQAKGDVLGVMDADHSHDAQLLTRMIDTINHKEIDCVIGSRKVKGGGAEQWPWRRRLFSAVATGLAYSCAGVSVQDPMSGYFMVTRGLFEGVRAKLKPKGYKILLEILGKADKVRTVELPYVFIDRKKGYSKLSFGVVVAYARQLLELMTYRFVRHRQ